MSARTGGNLRPSPSATPADSSHDIDRFLPRSGKEIFDLNKMMAQRMVDTFGKKVPIIPSLGNNDVYPHNIMEPGPNRVTQEFLTYVHATHSSSATLTT